VEAAGVVGVVGVVGVAAVSTEESDDPQAASERAMSEIPPARATFAFFFSQDETNFDTSVSFFVEASISIGNAPVEIIFILFAPYNIYQGVNPPGFSQS
jgi:hypothetical protein